MPSSWSPVVCGRLECRFYRFYDASSNVTQIWVSLLSQGEGYVICEMMSSSCVVSLDRILSDHLICIHILLSC